MFQGRVGPELRGAGEAHQAARRRRNVQLPPGQIGAEELEVVLDGAESQAEGGVPGPEAGLGEHV